MYSGSREDLRSETKGDGSPYTRDSRRGLGKEFVNTITQSLVSLFFMGKRKKIRDNRIDCPKTAGHSYIPVFRLIVGHFSLLGRLFIPRACKGVRDHLAFAFHVKRRTMNADRKNLNFCNCLVISESHD